MKPIMIIQADTKLCPFGVAKYCQSVECMAWKTIHERVEREDHSGNRDRVVKWAVETGRTMRREGAAGSQGILIIDETGHCARLLEK